MIILDSDQERFAYSYIEKHLGEQAPKGVKALSDYLEELDKAFYKRMMTAYRVDKKRRLDKEAGNGSVNVVLSKNAHARLKSMADSHGVTLSHFIEHYMNNGFISSEQNLSRENEILKASVNHYKTDLEQLKSDYKKELEQLQNELAEIKKVNTSLKRQNTKLNSNNEQLATNLTNEKAASATLLRRIRKALEKNGVTL